MAIVYACIVPGSAASFGERTAKACAGVSDQLRGFAPETALTITSRGGGQRGAIEIASGGGFDAGGGLIERALDEAKKDSVAAKRTVRWRELVASGPAALLEQVEAQVVLVGTCRLGLRAHFEFGRALGRAISSEEGRLAIVCGVELLRTQRGDAAGRVFDERYRRAIEEWDVKWLVNLPADVRRRAAEDAAAQTAVLMGALSGYQIQPRMLSYEAGEVALLVAAIDVLGARRKARAQRKPTVAMPPVKRVSGRQLVRALENLGWQVDRIRGSHYILRHQNRGRVTLAVPVHGNQTLPIGTQMSILKDAQVDVDEFNELV